MRSAIAVTPVSADAVVPSAAVVEDVGRGKESNVSRPMEPGVVDDGAHGSEQSAGAAAEGRVRWRNVAWMRRIVDRVAMSLSSTDRRAWKQAGVAADEEVDGKTWTASDLAGGSATEPVGAVGVSETKTSGMATWIATPTSDGVDQQHHCGKWWIAAQAKPSVVLEALDLDNCGPGGAVAVAVVVAEAPFRERTAGRTTLSAA